jgi:hypothetical protein
MGIGQSWARRAADLQPLKRLGFVKPAKPRSSSTAVEAWDAAPRVSVQRDGKRRIAQPNDRTQQVRGTRHAIVRVVLQGPLPGVR